ncbi:MAG TPA: FecR domain-containing protein [Gallionellaceae bacterium]|jgi:hypothetical protein|nr:MAG: hypothetical protein B7X61_15180 [Gallionellales bacterium 39-52-133]HQS59852.1 FecR domain-containing protein [Gallionellaceae bacterium]HQS76606.1 FecR domain-containing protein [Gallionellaceae bacterium]
MKNIYLLLATVFFIHSAPAAELFGTVDAVTGEVTVLTANGESLRVSSGQKIFEGQTIQTSASGEVHIASADSGLIALRPNSNVRIDRFSAKGEPADESVLTLFKGAMRAITGWVAKRNPSAYRIKTPTATIGVRGTDHETTVIETATGDSLPGTYNTVQEGITVVQTAHGEIEVRPGQHIFASRDDNAAPRLLAQHPGFFLRRQLRIEERIQQRKEAMQQHVKNIMEDRAEAVRENIGDRKPEIQKNREALKRRIQEHRARERTKP